MASSAAAPALAASAAAAAAAATAAAAARPSAELALPEGYKPNKDYAAMAREHLQQRQYRAGTGGGAAVGAEVICVMCRTQRCFDVIFPCEHMCVCRDCMRRNCIGEPTTEGAWAFCPLCCGEIKRILVQDGAEVEKYWAWVEEVKPKLPKDFALKFEIHGGLIREEVAERENKSAGRRGKGRRRSAACAVS